MALQQLAPTFSASVASTAALTASTTSNLTSGSFTPAATGCLLIVKAGTWGSTVTIGTPTNTGPVLTWHQIIATTVTSGQAPAKVFWAWCPGGTAMTVTVPFTNTNTSAGTASFSVERWYGAMINPTPVVHSISGKNATPFTDTITSTVANSVITFAGFDYNGVSTASPAYVGGPTALATGYHSASNFSAFYAYQSTGTTPGTVATYGSTAPAGQMTTLVAVELVPMYPISGLTEMFNDAASMSATFPTLYGGPTVVNGQLRIPATRTAGATDYRGAQTANLYTMIESSAFVKVVTVPPYLDSVAADVVTEYQFGSAAGGLSTGNFGVFEVRRTSATQINLVMKMNVSYADAAAVTITYDPVAMVFLRMRITSGAFYWETSPDGTTWTVRRTLARAPEWIVYSDCRVVLQAEKLSGTDNTGYAEWDNFNIVYTPVTRQLTSTDSAGSTDGATLRRTTVQLFATDGASSTDTAVLGDLKPGQLSSGDVSSATTSGTINRIRRFGGTVTDTSSGTDSTARVIDARKLARTDTSTASTTGSRTAIRRLVRSDAGSSTTQNILKPLSDARPLIGHDFATAQTFFLGTYLHVGELTGLSRGVSRTIALRFDVDITERQVFGTAYHERYREAGRGIKGPEITGVDPGVLSRYVLADRDRFGRS